METDRIMETLEKIADIDMSLFKILAGTYQDNALLKRFLGRNKNPVTAKKFWITSQASDLPESCEWGRGDNREENVYLTADTEAGRLCRIFLLAVWTQVSLGGEGGISRKLSLCRVCGHQIVGGRTDRVYCSDACKLKMNGQGDLLRKRKNVWESKWQEVTRPVPFKEYCRWLDEGKPLGDYGLWLRETLALPSS